MVLLLNSCFAQRPNDDKAYDILDKRGEVRLKVIINDKEDIEALSKISSIDKLNQDTVWVYCNKNQYARIKNKNWPVIILPPAGEHLDKQEKKLKSSSGWDQYPTYNEYIEMMYSFQDSFPNLCKIEKIGESINGHEILFVKISDHVNTSETEPDVMFSSSMHGDELGCYVISLRFISYLLEQYQTNMQIRSLIDTLEIWINPLANPDGTYFESDSSISGAKRFNANNVDLNRNFPDPDDGEHPDDNPWQPENIAMMDFIKQHQFVLSANLHGGTEVVNYPWDTWSKRHADDEWFRLISAEYADTARYYAGLDTVNYMSGYDDGITNGYDWYTISGGRQDWVTGFQHGREVTIEMHSNKIPSPSALPALWKYNYRSMVNYLENATRSILGVVQDSVTKQPLKAKISIPGYDDEHSVIYSDSSTGYFYRLLKDSTYNCLIESNGYNNKYVTNIVNGFYEINLMMVEKNAIQASQSPIHLNSCISGDRLIIKAEFQKQTSLHLRFVNVHGCNVFFKEVTTTPDGLLNERVNLSGFSNGFYMLVIETPNNRYTKKIML